MTTPVWAAHLVLAQDGQLGTNGLQTWMLNNLLPLLLMTVAMLLLWLGAGKGDNAAVAKRAGGIFICLTVVGLAVSGSGVHIGTWLASLLGA